MTVEERLTSLERTVSSRLGAIERRVEVAMNNEISWAQKHWGWLLLGTAVVFFVLGKLVG